MADREWRGWTLLAFAGACLFDYEPVAGLFFSLLAVSVMVHARFSERAEQKEPTNG